MAEAKVKRKLTINIKPLPGAAFSVTVNDVTSRPVGGNRETTGVLAEDELTGTAVAEALGIAFNKFRKSVASENPTELFGESEDE